MARVDIWATSPDQVEGKHVQQVIAFAGIGKLRDGNDCSNEFRCLSLLVPSSMLKRYADECLGTRFDDNGSALQDLVNEVGRRLGFHAVNGRYRGVAQQIGNDGLWFTQSGHAIVMECKTTDTYRIPLDVIAGYRRALISSGEISEDRSSVLIVVGRENTGDLEAQIRGSRHAWDIRLISVDALLRLMTLKEDIEDPASLEKVQDVLLPREFTKVDGIIDLVFSTAEDIREIAVGTPDDTEIAGDAGPKFIPVNFNDACIQRIQQRLGRPLTKRSSSNIRNSRWLPDGVLFSFAGAHSDRKQRLLVCICTRINTMP